MNEYNDQAKKFLEACGATLTIEPAGIESPAWDTKKHRAYNCVLKTPKGSMNIHFFDSIINTEILEMTDRAYYQKQTGENYDFASYNVKASFHNKLLAAKKKALPTEYDILACLQKYDVGSMDDFFAEFGYEIKCTKDMTNFINTYNAVVKEYNDVCRCFSEEQLEKLEEIN